MSQRIIFLMVIAGCLFLGAHMVASLASGETITVGGAGSGADYPTIMQAVENASVGDRILIYNGSYREEVVVNKSIELSGANLTNTIIEVVQGGVGITILAENVHLNAIRCNGSGNNISTGIYVGSNGVELSNVLCHDLDWGIHVNGSSHVLIVDSVLLNNSYGISLVDTSNSTLSKNKCYYNAQIGIFVSRSDNATISQNICSHHGNQGQGILCQQSREIVITENQCYDLEHAGIQLYQCVNSTLVGNHVSNNFIGLELSRTDSSRIQNNDCSRNEVGILIGHSHGNTISENLCSNNSQGISLDEAGSNWLLNNTCSTNHVGISLSQDSDGNRIHDNTLFHNKYREDSVTHGEGISMYSSFNDMKGNTCSFNHAGLVLSGSNNTIANNSFHDNWYGIRVDDRFTSGKPENNSVVNNSIYDNYHYGVSFQENDPRNRVMTAVNNWWGDDSGPYHPHENPRGKGDRINDNITFEPWLVKGNLEAVKEDSSTDPIYIIIGIVTIGSCGLVGYSLRREVYRFSLLSTLVVPLYSRISRKNIDMDILKDNVRGHIYRYITENPGVNYTTIRRDVGAGIGTITYHLTVLSREGYIRSAVNGKLKLFWLKDDFPGIQEAVLTPVQKKILHELTLYGKMSRMEIRERLDIPFSSLHVNIKHLEKRGRIEAERDGKSYIYSLREE